MSKVRFFINASFSSLWSHTTEFPFVSFLFTAQTETTKTNFLTPLFSLTFVSNPSVTLLCSTSCICFCYSISTPSILCKPFASEPQCLCYLLTGFLFFFFLIFLFHLYLLQLFNWFSCVYSFHLKKNTLPKSVLLKHWFNHIIPLPKNLLQFSFLPWK